MKTTNQTASISPQEAERVFLVFHDIKKVLHRNKHAGTWFWTDKESEWCSNVESAQFPTAWQAMLDACEPYLNPAD